MNNAVRRYFRRAAAGAAILLGTFGVLGAVGSPPLAQASTATSAAAVTSAAATGASTARTTSTAPTDSTGSAASVRSQPSGTDASCPATGTAASKSATVTAPTRARAIGGSASATVVWCPPAQGASQVTSYTVTAQPGGETVTAAVPNDWAIIDGLTDGTAYRFTVTANTKTASGTAKDTTSAVTPAKIAEPTDVVKGSPQSVSYDGYSMLIGGKRIYVTAVEFDPWRTPSPSLWLDDLQKAKAEGYDAITVYFDWDYNSPSPGAYDFSGVRDYNEFLNLAQQAGLYVIARPGPYINAETDGGGIPSWVLTSPNGYRSDVQPYLSAATQWLSEIDPIIAAHQVTKGGNVIAYQVENEYANQGTSADDYMAALEQQAKSDGIDVPFTFNQCCGSQTYTSGTGAVNISGTDNYPLGFNCANPTSFGNPQSGYPVYAEEPVYLPEYQGGSFDGWGGSGYDNCYDMTGPDFENVFYKDNIVQGSTMQSYYMGVGGTNWGWLPAPQVYSSYDYGAAIRETGEIGTPTDPNDIDTSKYGENKLINEFETSVAPLTQTAATTAPAADNSAITTVARSNPDDGTGFVYVRQTNASSTATVTTHLENVTADGQTFAAIPQSGAITLAGRDSKLLLTGYHFGTGGKQDLVYSTSELATQKTIGGVDTALLYDPKGSDGETVLHYTSQPNAHVLSGSATTTWDPSTGDLRLDYVHSGLTEVEITGGGAAPLRLLLADTDTAENFWPEQTSAGPVLVEGAYLVRTAAARRGTLDLTGDTSSTGKITVWGGSALSSLEWDGADVATSRGSDGSVTGTLTGPKPVTLPTLTNWKFASEAQQAQPGFNDSSWTLADHPVSNASSPSTPVLYASDYGYDHGFTWYRGHFTATGSETGVTLTADGISPTGAYSVWLNGAFLGSGSASGAQTQTYRFPAGAVTAGKDNVIAVLVENTGNPEGPSGEKTGLYSASLAGSSEPITWRLMGSPGGSTLQDPTRGIMNESGLYGQDNGWDLTGYPDSDWQNVTLPDLWSSRGVPAGIGWYRTSFALNLPKSSYVPIDVQIGADTTAAGTANYRAFIYVNGWLVGRYVNNAGPQHQFYVPAGILNDHGSNTLAIAVWGLDQAGGGLDSVSLVAAGNQAGGVPITQVASPGYSASVYGPPTAPAPTLAAVPSTPLATSSFTVKETLRNPVGTALKNASLSLNAPSGWTVSPAAASVGTVAAGGSGTATFTVTAPSSGLTAGTENLLARAVYDGSRTLLGTASVNVPAASLSDTFNNTGVTDDSNPNPSSSFIGFDGEGTSYSAQGLAADGITPGSTVTAGGVSFTWPSAASAEPDNTMAEGQTVSVSGSGSELGFLAAANNSAESGTGTIYYTDGTTQTFTLDVGNFWDASGQGGNPSNTQVAAVNYANYPTGSSGHTVYLFEQNVALESGKTIEAVTLPSLGSVAGYNPALHIFALSVGD